MKNKEEAEGGGEKSTAHADFIDCGSNPVTLILMMLIIIIMIPTTTWTEQSLCLSSKKVVSSSREMIQVFSGNEMTVATPGDIGHYLKMDDY